MSQLKFWINSALLALRFVVSGARCHHGVGVFQRVGMVRKFRRNVRSIKGYSTWRQHLLLAEEVLRIPKDVPGDVVECGCFNGTSTASLALACAAAGRKLWVCDSFEGLSEPRPEEKTEVPVNVPATWTYNKGDLSSDGGIEGVRANITRYGAVDCCEFVKGFFRDTLPDLPVESIVMVFADADLRSSTEDCVEHLWPKLQDGCRFYSHEPYSIHVVSLFYDQDWWDVHVGSPAPGFAGSADGVIEVLVPSGLGFAVKFDPEKATHERSEFLGFMKNRQATEGPTA